MWEGGINQEKMKNTSDFWQSMEEFSVLWEILVSERNQREKYTQTLSGRRGCVVVYVFTTLTGWAARPVTAGDQGEVFPVSRVQK